jgi:hypothetical protein
MYKMPSHISLSPPRENRLTSWVLLLNSEHNETGSQKVWRKLREEPLVPLGAILTTAAFINAYRYMRKGDHGGVQRMFRARVGAQAFTVLAMVAGGAYYGADREKRKELIKLEAQQRAEERHQKWLRELEVRDEEEKALAEHLARREARVKAKKAGVSVDGKTEAGAVLGGEGQKNESTILGALASSGSWFGMGKSSEKDAPAADAKQPAADDKPKTKATDKLEKSKTGGDQKS